MTSTMIREILQKNRLPWKYEPDEENILFNLYERSGKELCGFSKASFVFTSDQSETAGIIYEHKLVFMSYAMFTSICKLSDLIIASGMYDSIKNNPEYYNLTFVEKPYIYNESKKSVGISRNIERDKLFNFTLKILFDFIILHELGHLNNHHDVRDENRKDIISKEESIKSQSREVIADGYATVNIIKKLIYEINNSEYIESIKLYINSNRLLFSYYTTIIYLYFVMTTKPFKKENIYSVSHPSASFRSSIILANMIRNSSNFINLNESEALDITKEGIIRGNKIFSLISNDDNKPYYMEIMGEEYEKLYNELYKEGKNWVQ